MIGRVIGTYKIEQKLGEGGMGAVYRGVDTMLDRDVAIKALKPELASQTAVVERFRSEAVTLAKLNHPNIATLYSLFRQGDELYMVLEYVRGETLDEIIARRGALPAEEVIPVFLQILDGIDHAHQYGIIHRDIKPANMILTDGGILKVLDFGIARLLGTNRMTRAGNIIGTLEYMSPEQVKGLETDARSDVYSLGMMLYEVLTGRAPFETENEFEMMKLQTESMPPHPRSVNGSIPESVSEAILRAICKDPDQRFQTAGEFREFLIEAGFAERSATRRITGPNSTFAGTATFAAISKPDDVTRISDSDEHGIKETRLAGAAAAPAPVQEIKETRLGSAPVIESSSVPEDASPSFFDKLTWIHYAAAGSAAVFGAALLILIPVVIFSGVFSQTNDKENAVTNANTKKANANVVNAATPSPTPEQTPIRTVIEPTPEPRRLDPVEPAEPEPVSKPKPPERTKSDPPAKKAPTKKAPTNPRGRDLDRARCALTGDC